MVERKKSAKRVPAAKPESQRKPAASGSKAVVSQSRNLEPHEILVSPTITNAANMQAWGSFAGKPDLSHLSSALADKTARVITGDMVPVESLLFGQAMTLNTMFTNLSRRAASQEYLKQFQTYMTLALKAQAQCRATLESLAEIKNPRPVAFVKQANIANGPQQVNNGNFATSTHAHAHARETNSEQTKLLEATHGKWLEQGPQIAPGRADPAMATMGKGHRA